MYIYSLTHPSSNKIYIGKTNDIEMRYHQHNSKARCNGSKNKLYAWIKSLHNNVLMPDIKIVEETSDENWVEREKYWIAFYRNSIGYDRVLNLTDGGDESPMKGKKHTAESRKKMSDISTGKPGRHNIPHTTETRLKLSKSHMGMSPSNKGKPSPLRGIPRSPETIRKISESNKGRVIPIEVRDKIALTLTGRKHSKESLLLCSINNSKRKLTDDQVIEIRQRYKNEKITYRELGFIYGVDGSSISDIINRKSYKRII